MDYSIYKNSLGSDWSDFEEIVSREVTSDISLLNKINDHLFSTSGKKIRPLLVLLTAKACSGEISSLSKVCAAVSELIHTATLLHDDVVDDSEMRRGAFTVKSLFSSGASLLMGDYWLSKAVIILVKYNSNFQIIENYASTIEDLAQGEMLQMEKAEIPDEDIETTEKNYFEVIKRKTASLFVASLKSAAIAAGSTDDLIDAMSQYALHLGLSFQIRDDILDYSKKPLDGKDIGSDIAERKITLPLIGALKNSPHSKEILNRIREIDVVNKDSSSNIDIIKEVNKFVDKNRGVDYAKSILSDQIIMAKAKLAYLKPSQERDFLEEIVSSLAL